jgi:hypothetical protein
MNGGGQFFMTQRGQFRMAFDNVRKRGPARAFLDAGAGPFV